MIQEVSSKPIQTSNQGLKVQSLVLAGQWPRHASALLHRPANPCFAYRLLIGRKGKGKSLVLRIAFILTSPAARSQGWHGLPRFPLLNEPNRILQRVGSSVGGEPECLRGCGPGLGQFDTQKCRIPS